MSKETLKNLIELVPDEDIDLLHQVIIKFIPSDELEYDEMEAITLGKKDIALNGTVPFDEINWD